MDEQMDFMIEMKMDTLMGNIMEMNLENDLIITKNEFNI